MMGKKKKLQKEFIFLDNVHKLNAKNNNNKIPATPNFLILELASTTYSKQTL